MVVVEGVFRFIRLMVGSWADVPACTVCCAHRQFPSQRCRSSIAILSQIVEGQSTAPAALRVVVLPAPPATRYILPDAPTRPRPRAAETPARRDAGPAPRRGGRGMAAARLLPGGALDPLAPAVGVHPVGRRALAPDRRERAAAERGGGQRCDV